MIRVAVVVVVALGVVAALAQNGSRHASIDIDLEFVVLVTAVDHKPLYLNPRAVTYISPHDAKITRIGFIGGDVRSVEGHVDTIAAALLSPMPLATQLKLQPSKGDAP